MKIIKKALVLVLAAVMVIGTLTITSSAKTTEDNAGIATGCVLEFEQMIEGQTVKECSDSVCCVTNGFTLERSWWYKEVPLPTVLQDGSRIGVLTEKDGDLYYDGIQLTVRPEDELIEVGTSYTIVVEISSVSGTFTENSDVEINGTDMVFESRTNTLLGTNGDKALFAVTFYPLSKDAPHGIFTATGHSSGTLSNVDSNVEYSTDGGNSWFPCDSSKVELENIAPGSLQVAFVGDHSKIEYIYISMAEAPVNIYVTNCTTTANNDGIINGVNGTMQYMAEGDSKYTDCVADKVTGLKPGDYYVRTEASGCTLASGDVKVTIASHEAKAPVIKTQVVDAKVDTGKDATFSVKAEGEDLVYEWHYIAARDNVDRIISKDNAKNYYAGYDTDTLTVKDVNAAGTHEFDCEYSGDKYYCIVKNSGGQVQSNVGTYNVNHVAGTTWESDSTSHWNECACGAVMNKADHVDADKDSKCDVCKFDMSNTKTYTIKFGAAQTWTIGTKGNLEIICDGNLDNFKSLIIDKNEVDSKYYTTVSGSTIINIKDEFMNTLTDKIHTITLKYTDGSVSTFVTVTNGKTHDSEEETEETTEGTDETRETEEPESKEEKDVPTNSGFTTITWIFLGIIIVILIIMAILVAITIKKRKRRK